MSCGAISDPPITSNPASSSLRHGLAGVCVFGGDSIFTIRWAPFSVPSSLRPSVAPKEASVRWGRPRSAAGLPLRIPVSQDEDVFLSRFFLLIQMKRRAGAVCRAGPGFCAPISTDVVRPQASKWADPKERHPPPAHQPRVGARQKRADSQENNVRSLARTRFEPISQRTGASPSFWASATPACFEPILRFPFFEAEAAVRRRSSARRHPAMVRT